MRQFFFAIVLVAAAFGGGAMVNGPGFRWAQDHFFDYMGLKDGGEIASIDLPPAPGEADAPPAAAAQPDKKDRPSASDRKPRKADPNAKRKTLAEMFGGSKPSTPAEPKPSQPVAPEPASASAPAPGPPPTPAPTPMPTPPTLAGPSGAPGPEPSAPPAPLDPGVAPALLASLSSAPSNPPPAEVPPLTLPPAADAEAKDAPAAAGGGDWAELRRKLKAQGVTRYTIEADAGGRVVFSCLIPLAGKQAVSQRFEAEGDDEFAAAKAVLRRIILWRAARTPAPASS